MPTRQMNLPEYIFRILESSRWPGIIINRTRTKITYPNGEIIKLKNNSYHLNFITYSSERNEYFDRTRYKKLIIPRDYSFKNKLFFRRVSGNYKISYESQLKKIINPNDINLETIKIIPGTSAITVRGRTLILGNKVFSKIIKNAKEIYEKSKSYRLTTENYLADKKSEIYTRHSRRRVTYVEKGEFAFIIDRFNLLTKENKVDFLRYLNQEDIVSLELFLEQLLKREVLSQSFTTKLNDYFIKEKLRDIIRIGKSILALKTSNLGTNSAVEIISELSLENVTQLENLWQKYFGKYLLYLIFSYKKIFPKIELEDIQGDKKYPDFIGINHYNGLDVIEIKTHLKNILIWDSSHQNFYFSPEMSKAIVQTTNYLDAITRERFRNVDDRRNITSFTEEENLYHPRGIIIISSQNKLTNKTGENEKLKRDFTKLRNSLQNIEILTFNEIIGIAEEYITNIISQDEETLPDL